ncbi:hypothetical protein BJF90_19895 [Pseudonocardia sp. CNS-004]|nr:hypothetical protein BJF90_19895 [Pseudonocardia sp. CNS-004]
MKITGVVPWLVGSDGTGFYTHPNQRRFGTRDGVVEEIREIVESGHTGIKFDPFPGPGLGLDFDSDHLRANARHGFSG